MASSKKRRTRIYCGVEGIYGDIISYTPIVKWLKEKIPHSYLIFAISERCRKIKELLERDPLIDEVFVHKYAMTGMYDDIELEKRSTCDFVFENKVDHETDLWVAVRDATQEWAFLQGLNVPKGLHTRLFPEELSLAKGGCYGIDTPCPTRRWYGRYWEYMELPMLDEKKGDKYKYTFEQMVFLIKYASYIVTTNSIGMWVASAFDTPCILIQGNEFTPLVPPPPNKNMIVLEKMSSKDITPQEVKDAIKQLRPRVF